MCVIMCVRFFTQACNSKKRCLEDAKIGSMQRTARHFLPDAHVYPVAHMLARSLQRTHIATQSCHSHHGRHSCHSLVD